MVDADPNLEDQGVQGGDSYEIEFPDLQANLQPGDRYQIVTRCNMTQVNSSDNNFADGAEYQYIWNEDLQPGTHGYRFAFTDNWRTIGNPQAGETTQLPPAGVLISGPTVTSNRVPTLTNVTVTPTQGTTGTVFSYQATYTDLDNDAPKFMRVAVEAGQVQFNGTASAVTAATVQASGTATRITGNDLTDKNQNYTPGAWVNMLLRITSGQRKGASFRITANDATTITVASPLTGVVIGDSYQIIDPSTLTDDDANYAADALVGKILRFTSGAQKGAAFNIIGNDATTIRVSEGFNGAAAGDTYEVIKPLGPPTVYNMTKVNPNDNVYNDGVDYQYQTQLNVLPVGQVYLFQVSTNDGVAPVDTYAPLDHFAVGPDPVVLNSPPTLTAPPAPGQILSPPSGESGTTFTYTIVYTDQDNNPPAYVRVVIDGKAYNMQEVDSTDVIYSDGKTYQYSTQLALGRHSYHFETSDGIDDVILWRVRGLVQAVVNDKQPGVFQAVNLDGTPVNFAENEFVGQELSFFTNLAPLTAGGLPVPGRRVGSTVTITANDVNTITSSGANFTTETKDTGTITRVEPNLLTDESKSFTTNAWANLVLRMTSGSRAGDLFTIISNTTTTISVSQDTTGISVGDDYEILEGVLGRQFAVANTDFIGPTVNNLPTLSNGQVAPASGVPSTNFTYEVTYTDPDNHPPDDFFVRVWVDNANETLTSGAVVQVVDGDTVQVNIGRSVLADELVNQALVFTSGALLRQGAVITGNTASDASNNFNVDASGFNFAQVQAGDTFDLVPNYMTKRDPTDNNYTDGVVYQFSTSGLDPGLNHTFHFTAESTQFEAILSLRLPASGELSGPTVSANRSLTLSEGSVTPASGKSTDEYVWRVTYTDADNDQPQPLPPSTVAVPKVFIDGVAYEMRKQDYTDNQYTDGVIYVLKTSDQLLVPQATVTAINNDHITVQVNGANPNWSLNQHQNKRVQMTSGNANGREFLIRSNTDDTLVVDTDGDLIDVDDVAAEGVQVGDTLRIGIAGPQIGGGTHTYHFEATDGAAFDRLPATGEDSGPTVNFPPVLSAGGFAPSTPDETGTAENVSANVLTDNDKQFTPGVLAGALLTITSGPRAGDQYTIEDNTATQITVDQNFHPDTGLTPDYRVYTVDGSTATTFTFSVTYQDGDGTAPTLAEVVIDGTGESMTGTGTDYVNGVVFTRTRKFTAGVHNYFFRFSDGTEMTLLEAAPNTPFIGPVVSVNRAPTLSNEDVDPDQGTPTTTFTYRITYTDVDNNEPAFVQVTIASPSGSNTYDMVKEDPNDNTYTDGVVYMYQTTLPAGRQYTFRFAAHDGVDAAVDAPGGDDSLRTIPGPIVNTPPTLTNAAVNPASGSQGNSYTYTVTYTDADNNAPDESSDPDGFIRLYVTKPDGNPLAGSPFTMSKQDPSDTDFTDGMVYERLFPTATLMDVGSYQYRIEASDGIDTVDTGNISGPVVAQNLLPTLEDGNVTPTTGTVDTVFTYQVKYTDADGLLVGAPAPVVEVVIDAGTANEQHQQMTPTAPVSDANIKAGLVYEFKADPNAGTGLSEGTHTFHFEATDGIDTARFPPSGEITNPRVNYIPTLTNGRVTPALGTPQDTFTYEVTYTDQDNEAPQYVRVTILNPDSSEYGTFDMTAADQNAFDQGRVYRYLQNGLPAGKGYSFYFTTTDGVSPRTSQQWTGPDVNTRPVLTNAAVDPAQGPQNAVFTYTVIYTDADNHAPNYIRVRLFQGGQEIGGSPVAMSKQDPSDDTYTDGVTYRAQFTNYPAPTAPGNEYTFTVEAADNLDVGNSTAPSVQGNGPVVLPGNGPTLTNYSFDPDNADPLPDGEPTTNFTFQVTYTDADNQPPSLIRLFLDQPENAPDGAGADPTAEADPSDTNYTDGKVYLWQQILAPGEHNHFFRASDGTYTVQSILLTGPKVNNPSVLSPPADGRTLYPTQGSTSTQFQYRIVYTDADNDAPAYIRVHIYDATNAEIAGSPFALNKVDSNDNDYTDGVLYQTALTFSNTGTYSYRFEADDFDNAVYPSLDRVARWPVDADGNPPWDTLAGPTVNPNTAPTLTNLDVNPDTGTTSTVFTYSVTYTDADGGAPAYVRLIIDAGTGNQRVENLVKDPDDDDFTDGVQYTYQADPNAGTSLSEGAHTFHVEASDGVNAARAPATGEQSGPVVNFKPVLRNPRLTPDSGSIVTEFVWEIEYVDLNDQAPTFIRLFLDQPENAPDNAGYDPTEAADPTDTTYTDGKVYRWRRTLSAGDHTYFFRTSDGQDTVQYPVTGTLSTPTVADSNRAPTLTNGQVTPTLDVPGATFTYEVTYADPDNTAPSYIRVRIYDPQGQEIAGSPFAMAEADPNDTNLIDGKVYQYQTTALTTGKGYSFRYEASDGVNAVSTDSLAGPDVNTKPTLTNGSVDPAVGAPNVTFTYRITYTDADNHPPAAGSVKLHILKGGQEIAGSPITMSPEDPNDTDYTDGKVFVATRTDMPGPGSDYTFQINAADNLGVGNSNADVFIGDGPAVIANGAPALSGGAVSPDNPEPTPDGETTTNFTFTVTYTDLDGTNGDAPQYVRVAITTPGGTPLAGSPFDMLPTNPQDTNYTDGAAFRYSTTLSTPGLYSYHFEASDGTTAVQTTDVSGPRVNAAVQLSNGSVTPAAGGLNTNFIFRATYTDPDNNPPAYMRLHILGPDGQEITGSPFAMTKEDTSQTDYTVGIVYRYVTQFANTGVYKFHFEADDFTEASLVSKARLPLAGEINGPTVNANAPPELRNGSVSPASGTTADQYTYTVTYLDADNTDPANTNGYVRLVIDAGKVTERVVDLVKEPDDNDFVDGVVYTYQADPNASPPTGLAEGPHTFHFEASDGTVTTRLPATDELAGPQVNYKPQLSGGMVAPSSGTPGTTFTWQVTYTDLDNTAPTGLPGSNTGIQVVIDGTAFDMTAQDPNDTDYTDGAVFVYSRRLGLTPSPHTYFFRAADGVETVATAPVQGPTVTSNHAPVLSNPGVDPYKAQPGLATFFTFTVTYTDEDNNPPEQIQLLLNLQGETTTSVFDMAKQDPTDNTYTDGVVYEVTNVRLYNRGIYEFYFTARDLEASTRLPALGTPDDPDATPPIANEKFVGPIVNTPPQLANGSVSPTSGSAGNSYTYSVTYTDADNDAPTEIKVVITRPDNTTFEQPLTAQNPADVDYTDGAVFETTLIAGTLAQVGTYQFRFEANDGIDSARLPATGNTSGPLVNANAVLNLDQGQVSPTEGISSDVYTYTVVYTDVDNDPPAQFSPRVYIDNPTQSPLTGTVTAVNSATEIAHNLGDQAAEDALVGRTLVFISGSQQGQGYLITASDDQTLTAANVDFTNPDVSGSSFHVLNVMSKQDPNDNDYTDGVIYEFSTRLSEGPHQFHFWATDGTDVGRYPSTGELSGPQVNFKPQLLNPSLSPSTGSVTTLFTFQITYLDGDGEAPTLTGSQTGVQVVIDDTGYDMTTSDPSPDYANGVVYTLSRTLSAGGHNYYFRTSDGKEITRLPEAPDTFQTGDVAAQSRPPTLTDTQGRSGGEVTPLYGSPGTEFIYQVVYTDLDNNPPSLAGSATGVRVVILNPDDTEFGQFDLTEADPNDTDYTDGKVYQYQTTQLPLGNPYKFYFRTADDYSDEVTSPQKIGPHVNTAPALSNASISPTQGPQNGLYEYRVTYTDADNQPPFDSNNDGQPDVRVRILREGAEVGGISPLILTQEDPADTDYTDGATFLGTATNYPAEGEYTFEVVAWDNRLLAIGTATGVAGSELTDANANFTVDALRGYVLTLTSGVEAGTQFLILGNTATVITVDGTFNGTLAGDTYRVGPGNSEATLTGSGPTIQAGNAPVLSLPDGATSYFTPDNPDPVPDGEVTTDFRFQVKYTDSANRVPDYVQLELLDPAGTPIAGSPFTMRQTDPNDVNYTDGALFEYSLKLATPGQYQFRIVASNGTYTAQTSVSPVNGPLVNAVPTLTNGGVTPATGNTSTNFVYKVTYTDADNDAPAYIRVHILGPEGQEINGSPFSLEKQDSNDNDYTDGVIYRYVTKLTTDGVYKYHFTADDWTPNNGDVAGSLDESAREPASGEINGPAVNVNVAPILDRGSVTPTSGITADVYTYRVIYTDFDNTPPDYVRVVIDEGTPDKQVREMSKDPDDDDFTNGVEYTYQTDPTDPNRDLAEGPHTFHFEASDGTVNVREPAEGATPAELSGPQVNYKPTLTDSQGNVGGEVEPTSGGPNTRFVFRTIYADKDGDTPSLPGSQTGVQVLIDDTAFDMSTTNPNPNYVDGVIYTYITTLRVGTHKYQFRTSDGKDVVVTPLVENEPRVETIGPPVPPTLTEGQVNPTQGPRTTTFVYTVTYTDLNGEEPVGQLDQPGGQVVNPNGLPNSVTGVQVFIDGTAYDMQKVDPNDTEATDGIVYRYEHVFGASDVGGHTFYFLTTDGNTVVRDPETGEYDGPTVTNTAPSLTNGDVQPRSGLPTTTFTYTVTYTDADNDAPTFVKVFIEDGGQVKGYDMEPVDPNDTTYTDGAQYRLRLTLQARGAHSFYFLAGDGVATARLPAVGTADDPNASPPIANERFVGPQINYNPTLSNPSLSPTEGRKDDTYTFQVTYTDADNEAPIDPSTGETLVRLFVYNDRNDDNQINPADDDPPIGYTMYQQDPNDTDYTDGAVYVIDLEGVLPEGPHTFFFTASDAKESARLPAEDAAEDPNSVPPIDQYANFLGPTVNWPPELTAVTPGVVSQSGNNRSDDVYTFRVTFTDKNDEAPQRIQVIITGENESIPIVGDMVQADPTDTNFRDGALFEFSTQPGQLQPGAHQYYFEAEDRFETVELRPTADPTSTFSGPQVNYPPLLSSAAVSPTQGDPTTTFTYSVVYTDGDDVAPTSIELRVDEGTAQAQTVPMQADPTDTDFTDGVSFTAPVTGLASGVPHRFRIVATDGVETADTSASGTATNISGAVLTDSAANFGNLTADLHYLLFTSGADTGLYRVVSNTPTQIVVDRNLAAAVGDSYRVDRAGPLVNQAPVLTPVDPDGTPGDGVDPDEGTVNTAFTFRVRYTDADGVPPHEMGFVKVFIDDPNEAGPGFLMTPDPNDTDYTDGVIYTYVADPQADAGLTIGQHTFHFAASDGLEATQTAEETTKPYVHRPPELSGAAVISASGNNLSTDTYTFSVTYLDLDNDAPQEITLRIWGTDVQGNPTDDITATLSGGQVVPQDPSDTDYTDGAVFIYSTILSSGAHTFQFTAVDAFDETADTGVQTGPQVNYRPVLSNPVITARTAAGEALNYNQSTATYTYQVTYTDLDNDPPSQVTVIIQGTDAQGNPTDDITQPMAKLDENDTDYTDGVVYTFSTTLASGPHTYRFEAADAVEDAEPLFGAGPQVNFAPILANGQVTSASGQNRSDDTYTYQVQYTDEDNVPPSVIRLVIDAGTASERVETPTKDPQDDDFTDGVLYTFTIDGPSLGGGPHTFHFEATNSAEESDRYPAVGEAAGPHVNRVPTLSNPSVTSTSGNNLSTDTYTFRVTYTDLDNDPPNPITLTISGADNLTPDLVKENPEDSDYTDGVVYKAEVKLSGGDHTYTFSASDGVEDAPAVSANEPKVNHRPVLSEPQVTPTAGTIETAFTYSVRYTDLDGTAPEYVKLFIDNPEEEPGVGQVVVMSTEETDFAAGVTYTATLDHLTPGEHTFHFSASDGLEKAIPLPEQSGPTVNARPTLTDPSVTPEMGTLTTEFEYRVTYTDPDGNAPLFVKLFVDNPDEEEGVGIVRQMAIADQVPDFAAGVQYIARLQLSAGSHTFHIRAHDRVEEAVTAEIEGPTVNSAPTLTNPAVTPEVGKERDTYTFRVTYTDVDGDAPAEPGVELIVAQRSETGQPVSGTEQVFPTTPAEEAPDYAAGAVFRAVLLPGTLKPGWYVFYFRAKDALNPQVSTREALGTVRVNAAPTLTDAEVNPPEGGKRVEFTFSVRYADADGDPPEGEVLLFLDQATTGEAMSPTVDLANADFVSGVVYELKRTLEPGRHQFRIRATDGIDTVETTATGPMVDNEPVLSGGSVSPISGTEATDFTFQVTYTDVDNDQPAFVKVFVTSATGRETGFDMFQADPTDRVYTNGALFQVTTRLANGRYAYHFEASDGRTTVTTDPQTGPRVRIAPTLTSGEVTPMSGDTNTEFTFRVVFTDAQNEPPQRVVVVIDGEERAMQKANPEDVDFTDGVLYALTTRLPAGTHRFHFEAVSGPDTLRLPAVGEIEGLVVVEGAKLVINPLPDTQLGTPVVISGTLEAPAGRPVADDTLTLTLTPPEQPPAAPRQTEEADQVPPLEPLTITLSTDEEGRYRVVIVLRGTGRWRVAVRWAGNQDFGAVTERATLNIVPATQTFAPGLHMMTVPVRLKPTELDVIDQVFTGFDTLHLARWLPAEGRYLEVTRQSAASLFGPGLGFWVEFRNATGAAIVARGEGLIPDQSQPFVIPLVAGWNQVGNPFLRTIDWAAARIRFQNETVDLETAEANGWASSFAWNFDQQAGYGLVHATVANATRAVQPWQSLWVRAFVDCELLLYPIEYRGRAVNEPGRARSANGDWAVPLVARAAGRADAYNFFGVAAAAASGRDIYRLETPPLPAGYVDVSFAHIRTRGAQPNAYYATDFRAAPSSRMVWEVVVRTDLVGEEVTLTWPDLTQVPDNYSLWLTDLAANETRYLRATSHYTFTATEPVRQFRLVAETAQPGALAPTFFRVDTTRGPAAATITFVLPQAALVDVDILSPTQRPVRALSRTRAAPAGLNTLTWDGLDEEGRPVPNGQYLCQITVRTEEGRQVKVTQRFVVMR